MGTSEINEIENGNKMEKINIFDLKDLSERKEVVKILTENENVKIEKIISTGQVTGWQESDKNEFVILIQGNAEIEYYRNRSCEDKNFNANENIIKNIKNTNDMKLQLGKGDTVLIKKEERHRVSYTSKNPCCIWICIFFD
ncbi:hypothetical protein JMUB3936_1435 [Leptotrichia wadei]|jgi:hypothetical protein cdivTM_09823|uniref:Cupin domain protein n=1 Tax=Leptotrichia wadei TaxID=157687 RepID=A0A510KWJ0_9FUSO|nr:hypothetical protein [Leptotrichia wadei]BBM55151.1 hypothetical protein JMUB3936_1435 [Leptotrichia wadei]